MGKNTPTRQEFIIDNLRIELDVVEEKEDRNRVIPWHFGLARLLTAKAQRRKGYNIVAINTKCSVDKQRVNH